MKDAIIALVRPATSDTHPSRPSAPRPSRPSRLRSRSARRPAAALAMVLTAAPANAQEELPDTVYGLDGIEVVVGSRAGVRNPAELAVPVDIYGAEELARLGEVDLAEALGRIAPSFNSTRFQGGDGAALHVATLRGMSADQVLVLVNGKRRHAVAFPKVIASQGLGTTGTDLRAIPVHAIKRIEVLREGAASQYGSDAIAGVINIVLKDDADGVTTSTYLGRTSWGDGERVLASANAGFGLGADGFLNLTVEYGNQQPTTRAGMAPTCFGPDASYAPCANGGRTAQLQRIGEPDYQSAAVALNAAVAAGESSEFYAFATWSGREAVADGLYRKADWVPRNVSYVHPDGFFPTEESELNDISSVVGLRGDWGDWSADLSLGMGQGEFRFNAANSINPSYAAEYLSRNPEATPDAIASNSGPANVFSGALALRQIDVNADAARDLTLGSAPAHVALGGAYRRESFWMTAGEQASYACGPSSSPGSFPAAHEQNTDGSAFASCGIQGFPGYSPASADASERSRNSFGAYVDMEVEPGRVFSLGAALRFENYSDAGTSLTGKVSGRLELGESGAALRSAVSTGFRAPRLPQRGFNTVIFQGGGGGLTSTGFLPEGDDIACNDFDACSLAHETSRSYTLGFVYSSDSGFLFTADWYRVAVADAIVLTQGLGPDHGLRANAQFQGRPVDGVSFWTNAVDTRTQGLDVVATWRARGMSWGAVDLTASLHRNETELTANRNPAFVRETQTMLLTENQPKQRIGAGVDVRLAQGIGARFRLNHIGSLMSPFIFEEPVTIDAAAIADAELSVEVAGRVRLAVGANNLLDKLPNKLPDGHVAQLWAFDYPAESPYGLAGRVAYVRADFAM